MLSRIRTQAKGIVRKMGLHIAGTNDPVLNFHSDHYLRHNARRLEHLASLKISVAGKSVLEVGAGIGDHSHYFIDRGCCVTITEARTENLSYLKERYPGYNAFQLDMESPSKVGGSPFDVVHCYGLLYHLSNPKNALLFLSQNTKGILLLETCVSFGESAEINLIEEASSNPTQAYSGTGCRPTRAWLFRELKDLFEYVYVPTTQPWHEQFPLDWSAPEKHQADLQRAIFIASRERLDNPLLKPSLVLQQTRHE